MTDDTQRDHDHRTTIQVWLADVPAPTDAISVGEWSQWEGTHYTRAFTTHTTPAAPGGVATAGIQHNDGSTERHIIVTGIDGHELSPEQARALAAALTAAADRIT